MKPREKILIGVALAIMIATVLLVVVLAPTPAQRASLQAKDIGLSGWRQVSSEPAPVDTSMKETSAYVTVLEGPTPDGNLTVTSHVHVFDTAADASSYFANLPADLLAPGNETPLNSSNWEDGLVEDSNTGGNLTIAFLSGTTVTVMEFYGPGMDYYVELQWAEQIANIQAGRIIDTGL